jgi:hypothetical protein
MIQTFPVTLTTDVSGAAAGYTPTCSGFVLGVRYVPGTLPIDTGATVTITGNVSGIPIITITGLGTSPLTVHPRAAAVSVANAPLYYSGTAPVGVRIPIADEAVKIVVASGASTKSGTFFVYVDGEEN